MDLVSFGAVDRLRVEIAKVISITGRKRVMWVTCFFALMGLCSSAVASTSYARTGVSGATMTQDRAGEVSDGASLSINAGSNQQDPEILRSVSQQVSVLLFDLLKTSADPREDLFLAFNKDEAMTSDWQATLDYFSPNVGDPNSTQSVVKVASAGDSDRSARLDTQWVSSSDVLPSGPVTVVRDVVHAVQSEAQYYTGAEDQDGLEVNDDPRDSLSDNLLAPGFRYFEAFSENVGLDASGIESQMLSREFPVLGEADLMGWSLTYGRSFGLADHWRTLHWVNQLQSETHSEGSDHGRFISVPIMSNNTVRVLGILNQSNVDETLGIVFGKLAPGWRLSNTANVLYFAMNPLERVQAEEGAAAERYFAMVNVKTGTQWVTLESLDGRKRGAVFAPVMKGTATYLDVSTVREHSIVTGQIEMARTGIDEFEEPLEGNSVRVAGLSFASVQSPEDQILSSPTQYDGYFQLEGVCAFGNFPIYLESQGTSLFSFVHRYRVMQWNLENVILTRIPTQKLYEWQLSVAHKQSGDQLGVPSGMVVSSFAGLVQSNPDAMLVPHSKTLVAQEDLTPLSYSIRANGSLIRPRHFVQYEERSVTLMAAEGVTLLQLQDFQHSVDEPLDQFSEAIPTSLGVVNIVGPY